jgi:integrase/recombinase XerD
MSLLAFKTQLTFEDIIVGFLYKYETELLQKNNSLTTVGIYLRPLGRIYNIAKEKNHVLNQLYPFGIRKYIIIEPA